jgi:hypothetical protein
MTQCSNEILGDRVKAAREASALATTLLHYITLKGFLSGLIQEGPECNQIREALTNLITTTTATGQNPTIA